jgi:hypothetical protein
MTYPRASSCFAASSTDRLALSFSTLEHCSQAVIVDLFAPLDPLHRPLCNPGFHRKRDLFHSRSLPEHCYGSSDFLRR